METSADYFGVGGFLGDCGAEAEANVRYGVYEGGLD